jgi:hypothetical protein
MAHFLRKTGENLLPTPDSASRRVGSRRQRAARARRCHRQSLDSGGAGALEAADLVQSGTAKRVAVFAYPPSGADQEFIRRGLPYEEASTRQIRQLRWLGVTDVMQIPMTASGTESEGRVLPSWCDKYQFRSVVFVAASPDHASRGAFLHVRRAGARRRSVRRDRVRQLVMRRVRG